MVIQIYIITLTFFVLIFKIGKLKIMMCSVDHETTVITAKTNNPKHLSLQKLQYSYMLHTVIS